MQALELLPKELKPQLKRHSCTEVYENVYVLHAFELLPRELKPQLKRQSRTEVYENTYVFVLTSGSTEGTQTATQIQLKHI